MSAVVDLVSDVVGGVVEAVGDVVESVVDVVKDVGSAIDDYVIQPILDDPLTAIATVAGAAFLGPAIAPMLGTGLGAATGYVATGLGAAAGNTAAGLAQGEDFDEAVKGGLLAGVTAGATSAGFDYLTGGGAWAPEASAPAAPGYDTAAMDALVDDIMARPDVPGGAPVAESFPVTPQPTITSTDLPPLTSVADDALTGGTSGTAAASADPLGDFIAQLPGMTDDAAAAGAGSSAISGVPEVPTNYLLDGVKFPSTEGLKVPEISLDAPIPRDLMGNVDYSLTAGMDFTGPGLQMPSSPNISSMGGGQGLTVDVAGLPEFTYSMDSIDPAMRGMSDSWVGDNGQLYGLEQPGGTLSQYGVTPTPDVINYPSTSAAVTDTRTLGDKLKNFEFGDISMGDIGKAAIGYAVENPLTTLAAVTLAGGVLGGPPEMPSGPPAGGGGTRDENFTRPMDMYNYLREQQQYGGDIYGYGTQGGEHKFFTPSRFEPVPIPTPAKVGGLIQYKQRLAAGGVAQPQMPQTPQRGMDPRQAAMAAMQQRAAMAKRQGALAQMQGGMPGGMGGQMPPQAQGAMPGSMPQRRQGPINRNPKTAYYQYGTPPAMAMGGLNMVRSMNVGGGADGRSDDVDALLSDGEYVIDAETVAMLGNGSSEAGASRLDQMREQVRKHKGQNLSKGKISPDAKSPLAYLKGA